MTGVIPPFIACTFNVRFGTAEDGENSWDRRKRSLLETLTQLNPDILATQEALVFQIHEIQQRFADWQVVGNGRFKGIPSRRPQEADPGEHCAIFFRRSRFRLLETCTRWLSETPEKAGSRGWGADLPRIVTTASFQCLQSGMRLDVYNTHFDWGEHFTQGAIGLLRQWISESLDQSAVLLMGDFNVDARSAEHEALTSIPLREDRRLRDVFDDHRGQTGTRHDFTGIAPECIDWILASSDLIVHEAWTDISSVEGQYPSDHFPVLSRLRYRTGRHS